MTIYWDLGNDKNTVDRPDVEPDSFVADVRSNGKRRNSKSKNKKIDKVAEARKYGTFIFYTEERQKMLLFGKSGN